MSTSRSPTPAPGAAVLAMVLAVAVAAPASADPQADYESGRKAFYDDDLFGAMRNLKRAADAGHTPAMTLLAYILDRAEQDDAALDLYRRAARAGDAEAMYGLGTMLAAGEGVEPDPAAALEWFRRAAEAGHGHAMVVLAEAHLKGGLGLEPDRERALEWLRRAAGQGYEPARQRLESLTAAPPR